MKARVLVLEPFGGGSHAAFLRGWERYSCLHLTHIQLPAVHWKWRSRHSSLTLAKMANDFVSQGQRFDVIFCSDMLNLPEWKGFACPHLQSLPSIAYFHENQFTYPLSEGQTRDYQYAYGNVLTALAATAICFNSYFHLREFASAAKGWLKRMPDYRHLEEFASAMDKSRVLPPGIDSPVPRDGFSMPTKPSGPLKLGWVARWEHDKRPDRFLNLIRELLARGIEFRLILLGQQFSRPSVILQELQHVAGNHIEHVGYAESKAGYWDWLSKIDIVVSTADHEFFGVGIAEAIAAGATPVLPNRLAYPELLQVERYPDHRRYLYNDESELLRLVENGLRGNLAGPRLAESMNAFAWRNLAAKYDELCAEVASSQA